MLTRLLILFRITSWIKKIEISLFFFLSKELNCSFSLGVWAEDISNLPPHFHLYFGGEAAYYILKWSIDQLARKRACQILALPCSISSTYWMFSWTRWASARQKINFCQVSKLNEFSGGLRSTRGGIDFYGIRTDAESGGNTYSAIHSWQSLKGIPRKEHKVRARYICLCWSPLISCQF